MIADTWLLIGLRQQMFWNSLRKGSLARKLLTAFGVLWLIGGVGGFAALLGFGAGRLLRRFPDLGLEALLPGIDLASWLAAAQLPDSAFAEVVVRQPSYLTGLAEVLLATPVETWREWLGWHILHGGAVFLSSDFVHENFAFYGTTLTGAPQLRERWKRGVGLVEGNLGEALGELYVAEHFPPAAKARPSSPAPTRSAPTPNSSRSF